jgi:hypothetical protein
MIKCNYCYLNHVLDRSKYLFIFICGVQFFYLTILTTPVFFNLIIFFIVASFGFLVINKISKNLKKIIIYEFDSNIFLILFFFSAVVTLFLSRIPYIISVISIGLSETRNIEDLGAGGIYSFITVLFYPLSIILIFYNSNAKLKFYCLLVSFLICIVDIIFLGTRNAPFFIIFFHFIFYKKTIKINFKNIILLLFLFFLIIYLFEYSTRVRSGYIGFPGDYWLWNSTESEVMSLSKLNLPLYTFFNQDFWCVLPVFYLASYVSHSIPEFAFFLSNFDFFTYPKFYILYDYWLMSTFQDRTEITALIEIAKFNPGFYQTMYSSLFIDFGILLTGMLFSYITFIKNKITYLVQIYLLPVMIFSGIENYIYTGLTPIRFLLFIMFGYIFLRFGFKKI